MSNRATLLMAAIMTAVIAWPVSAAPAAEGAVGQGVIDIGTIGTCDEHGYSHIQGTGLLSDGDGATREYLVRSTMYASTVSPIAGDLKLCGTLTSDGATGPSCQRFSSNDGSGKLNHAGRSYSITDFSFEVTHAPLQLHFAAFSAKGLALTGPNAGEVRDIAGAMWLQGGYHACGTGWTSGSVHFAQIAIS